MKLHLGCGKRNLGKDWLHIDLQNFDHIDYICDISKLDIFLNDSVEGVYVCHVLEHFPRSQLETVLSEWYRVLKPNGILRISVPDFEQVCKLYNRGLEINNFYGLVSGGQRNQYDIHYHIFDEKSLSKKLYEIGFTKVDRYKWEDFLPKDFDDYSRAYIPHMDFKNGELVSLNLICIK
jgi:predicted SAM-dependent methyltransferase